MPEVDDVVRPLKFFPKFTDVFSTGNWYARQQSTVPSILPRNDPSGLRVPLLVATSIYCSIAILTEKSATK